MVLQAIQWPFDQRRFKWQENKNQLKSKDIKSIPNGVLIADIAKNVIKSDNAVFYTQRDITVELCPLIVG